MMFSPGGLPKRMPSMPPCRETSPTRTCGGYSVRTSLECCGASSFITSTCSVGLMAIRLSRRRPRTGSTGATVIGVTSWPPISYRCRTNGNIPGSQPGTSPFICVTLSLIDPDFAKKQLLLLCEVWLMHPNGALPAYEWAFGDVNPPVHAWAAMRVFENDRNQRGGTGDLAFLARIFHKLLLNFTWWVNRKDPQGLNLFEGGFLGLDNIGVFDRSRPLPTGGYLEQSDGTAWMAMFCLNMLRVAVELSRRDPVYEDMAIKFLDHFLHIAGAMTDIGQRGIGLWNDEDNF